MSSLARGGFALKVKTRGGFGSAGSVAETLDLGGVLEDQIAVPEGVLKFIVGTSKGGESPDGGEGENGRGAEGPKSWLFEKLQEFHGNSVIEWGL